MTAVFAHWLSEACRQEIFAADHLVELWRREAVIALLGFLRRWRSIFRQQVHLPSVARHRLNSELQRPLLCLPQQRHQHGSIEHPEENGAEGPTAGAEAPAPCLHHHWHSPRRQAVESGWTAPHLPCR